MVRSALILHEALGLAIEELYGERAAEVALPLARHFEGPACAEDHNLSAGCRRRGCQLYANVEAVAHYRKALALAEREQVAMEIRFSLYTRLGKILELDSHSTRPWPLFNHGNVARQSDDQAMRLSAKMSQAAIHAAPYPGPKP